MTEGRPRRFWQPRSLQGRLAWRLGLLLLGTVALVLLPLIVRLEETGGTVQRNVLRGQAADLQEVFNHAGIGLDRLPESLANRYVLEDEGMLYAVWDQYGRLVTQSLPGAARSLRAGLEGAGDQDYFFRAGSDPERYALARRIQVHSAAMTLAVAQSPTPDQRIINDLLKEFVRDILLFGIPFALIAAAVGTLTIRSSLKPIQRVSAEAAAIGLDRLDHRLDGRGLPSELLPLVDAFNVALARLDGSFRHHRRFIADAAHQLRTPLAVAQARLDSHIADTSAGQPPAPILGEVRGDIRRLSRLVAQLLSLSRLSATPLPMSDRVGAADLVGEELRALAPYVRAAGKSLTLDVVDDFTLTCNASALAEALRNLVENAVSYGPPGDAVEVQVGPGLVLAVGDRGPGLQGEDPALLAEPFVRGHAATPGGGSGLGLAIAREIMAQHGGRLLAADRDGGGALFSLRFSG